MPKCQSEVKEAIFGLYSDGTTGSDGISFTFYQKFWELIKSDLMSLLMNSKRGIRHLHA
jgi:hypothetical protein